MVKLSVKKDMKTEQCRPTTAFSVLAQKTHKTDKINYFPFTSLESCSVVRMQQLFPQTTTKKKSCIKPIHKYNKCTCLLIYSFDSYDKLNVFAFAVLCKSLEPHIISIYSPSRETVF